MTHDSYPDIKKMLQMYGASYATDFTNFTIAKVVDLNNMMSQ